MVPDTRFMPLPDEPVDVPPLRVARDLREMGRAPRAQNRVGQTRLRRGIYVDSTEWTETRAESRHIARIDAVAATRKVAVVFSHTSAAVLHGIPLLEDPGSVVHATTDPSVRRRHGGIAWHHRSLPAGSIVRRDGRLVTSFAQTLVDLARTECFASAVVALDACLSDPRSRRRWDEPAARVPLEVLEEMVGRIAGQPGVRAAAAALRFADGRSESVGESLSRVVMHAWGVPLPELQSSLSCPSGRTRRVDFLWPDEGIVGEFDGFVKYSRLASDDGRPASDVLWEEKRREDDLRATGRAVVRWTWSDALEGGPLLRTLDRHGLSATRHRARPVFTKGTR